MNPKLPVPEQGGKQIDFAQMMKSPGDLTAQAARAVAERRGGGTYGGGGGGDYGAGPGGRARTLGNLEVLSDTQGVDFGPYLSRVVDAVRRNWYTLIPEAARAPLLKRGKVAIEFAILPDGQGCRHEDHWSFGRRVARSRCMGWNHRVESIRSVAVGISRALSGLAFPFLLQPAKGRYRIAPQVGGD